MLKSIFMMPDLEGVAGVVSFVDQTYADGKFYEQAKKLGTAEVNAAVEGMAAAGVEDVLVLDGHGPGGLIYEELHPMVRLMHGRPLAPWARLAPYFAECDACMIVGQHAMAGITTSNQSHTEDPEKVEYYRINGRLVGEIAECALYCGELGLPLIFVSGEEDACKEAEEAIPGVVTVPVKKGLGRGSAISLSAPEARRRIREGARLAVERFNTNPTPPLRWPGPYVLEVRLFFPEDADAWARVPGTERVDARTVRRTSDKILDLFWR